MITEESHRMTTECNCCTSVRLLRRYCLYLQRCYHRSEEINFNYTQTTNIHSRKLALTASLHSANLTTP
jgi:hypothetical protein